ncbi:MAG: hypothetical protein P1U56_09880 [Saprospiraceae bacterium]|nr:hypothetical protein [Saprospiraceae bacterium]
MTKEAHTIYIGTMTLTVLAITYYVAASGYSYYSLPIEERFYHENYDWFKPSGIMGQGLGVIGTAMITFGVAIYIARKRYGFLKNWIRLKYLLEFHIFLCTLGPILILFHTTFKFGGIVSIAFWSMVAVVLSGIIGRFIYIQIPRSIEGQELSMQDIQKKRQEITQQVLRLESIDQTIVETIFSSESQVTNGLLSLFEKRKKAREIKKFLGNKNISKGTTTKILRLVSEEIALSSKIGRLEKMQKLFKYWHVVHMPFAIIMVVIVLIHVGVTIALGYKWIF